MSLRKTWTGTMTGLAVVLAAAPAVAQQATPSTNQSTPTPTPGTIGNPALENFSLNGTVTREAAPPPPARTPPATRTPTPTPTPSPAPAPSAEAPAPSARREASPAPAPAPAPASPASTVTTPSVTPSPSAPLPDPIILPPSADSVGAAPDLMPPAPAPSGGLPWPWIAALAVALVGAAAWWMTKRKNESDSLAFAGPSPDVVAPGPVAAPAPRPVPAPRPAPRPDPTPAPRPPVADKPAPATGAVIGADGGIVSRALQPRLAFELVPLKFETDGESNVRLTFELVVANVGSAPARDIRVEAKLFNAGPDQDRQIATFFQAPGAMGANLPPIGPRDRVPLRSRVGMTAADYQALQMGGRSLVVPMLAVNAVYRGSAGELQDSASWLVGRPPNSDSGDVKLGPFALGKAHSTNKLASLQHSAGLNR